MPSVLRNPRYELYAQGVAIGLPKFEAYQKAGFRGKGPKSYLQLDRKVEIKQRIREIQAHGALRAELTRRDVLNRIVEDWDSARRLGQMSSALKAAELYGRDAHHMFVERKEIGAPGDFDGKSEEELRQIISDEMKDLGWDTALIPPDKSLN